MGRPLTLFVNISTIEKSIAGPNKITMEENLEKIFLFLVNVRTKESIKGNNSGDICDNLSQ
jgi:hypothetical protein